MGTEKSSEADSNLFVRCDAGSLFPRFKLGDSLLLDNVPAAPGDEVSVLMFDGRRLLRELVSSTARQIKVHSRTQGFETINTLRIASVDRIGAIVKLAHGEPGDDPAN